MATFLLKTEPETYSYSDLERDGQTAWDGVRNHLAMRYLREMKPGDEAFIYHSVSDKEVVGIAKVLGNLRRDPKDETNTFDCIDIAPLRRLKRPVSLAEFKAAGWHDFDLVRMSRLSVMTVPDHIRDWLLDAENQPADTTKPAPRPKAAAKPKVATKAKAAAKKKPAAAKKKAPAKKATAKAKPVAKG